MSLRRFALGLAFVSACASEPLPPQVAHAGFLLQTFHARFTTQSVDLGDRAAQDADWYPFSFFGTRAAKATAVAFNSDGSMTLGNDPFDDVSLATAAPARTPTGWVGRAFGGGGYFEATLKFDPDKTVAAHGKAWPSFWSLPIEHAVSLPGEQWHGQPAGYLHFIEPDFFEYDVWSFKPRGSYGGAIHEWYGKFRETCPGKSFCSVSNDNFVIATPPGTNFRNFHKFGMLWVPATKLAPGSVRYFFDREPTGDQVTWSLYEEQPPVPGKAPWTFGILDRQHLVLIVGSGTNQPMTVSEVSVWQASTSGNLESPSKGTIHP